MSSIYRKGRDGYYYYQTYVFNPVTGKKDKRIFHSLSTKNQSEAEQKQIQLDNKYEKNNLIDNKKISLQTIKISKKMIIITSTVVITLFISNQFDTISNNKKKSNQSSIIIKEIDTNKKEEKKNNKIKIQNLKIENKQIPIKEKLGIGTPETLNNDSSVNIKPIIPKYTIQRVDHLSGAFEQGKIFITVEKPVNNNGFLLLCEKITKQYDEFSNIIICLYDDTNIGKSLAMGRKEFISKQEEQKAWLVMYTYNDVEGPYFDDNPGGYLGAF